MVIYIHGIGEQKPARDLKAEWDLALFGSDQGPRSRMVYWSDLIHRNRPGVRARSAVDYAEALAARFGVQEPGRRPRAKVLPLPIFLRKPISRAFLKTFLTDSAAYFFNSGTRKAIRKRLHDQLIDCRGPVTVVAHSQGSVIALEVLSALGTRVNVTKLITVGSPLGLQEVQDWLDVPPHQKPFQVPASVCLWHNFADPLDPVALDKGLRGEFVQRTRTGEPRDTVVIDDLIVTDGTRRMAGFNPHSAAGYLAHPKVRRSVCDAIKMDSMGRFVVARDVAERLSVEQRHPVLIEILEPGYPSLGESRAQVRRRESRKRAALTIAARVDQTRKALTDVIRSCAAATGDDPAAAVRAARIDPLRRFVAARLTPDEIRTVALKHQQLSVYAVWQSSMKRALTQRSRAVLQADAALESYGACGRNIVWAVLDTGVRANHEHFSRHKTIRAVWDCTKQGPPKLLREDADKNGHGSHVAGIIAGQPPAASANSSFMGVAPEAGLVIYKVLNDQGEGEDAWIIKALDHIATQNENVAGQVIHGINLSLGGPYDSTVYGCGFTPICQELRRQWRSGVLVVVASGNEGQLDVQTFDGEVEINTHMSIGDPANLEDCVAVGSVNADKPHLYGVSPFSSRGPTSDGRLKPDVVAPGERISSVNARHAHGAEAYRVDSGTSMAAPHVSGLLAAFLSARREFIGRPDEVKRILLDTCTDLGRDRYHQGRGLPNLMKMLLSV